MHFFHSKKRERNLLPLNMLLDISYTKCKFKFVFKTFEASAQQQNRVKRQPMKWDKIFINHISAKRLISKIYKNSNNSIARELIT